MRETGVVRWRLGDTREEVEAAKPYLGQARLQLGILKNSMAMGNQQQGLRTITLPDGTVIRSQSVMGQDAVQITPTPAAVAAAAIGYLPAPQRMWVPRLIDSRAWLRGPDGPPMLNHYIGEGDYADHLLVFDGSLRLVFFMGGQSDYTQSFGSYGYNYESSSVLSSRVMEDTVYINGEEYYQVEIIHDWVWGYSNGGYNITVFRGYEPLSYQITTVPGDSDSGSDSAATLIYTFPVALYTPEEALASALSNEEGQYNNDESWTTSYGGLSVSEVQGTEPYLYKEADFYYTEVYVNGYEGYTDVQHGSLFNPLTLNAAYVSDVYLFSLVGWQYIDSMTYQEWLSYCAANGYSSYNGTFLDSHYEKPVNGLTVTQYGPDPYESVTNTVPGTTRTGYIYVGGEWYIVALGGAINEGGGGAVEVWYTKDVY